MSMTRGAESSVLERLQVLAEAQPSVRMYVALDRNARETAALTRRETWEASLGVANALGSRSDLHPGERVLLIYEPGLDFIPALFGAMLAGLVAVPVPVPNPIDPGPGLELVSTIAGDCSAKAILSSRSYRRMKQVGGVVRLVRGRRSATRWPRLPWIDTTKCRPTTRLARGVGQGVEPTALLQYTSGSTSTPKGVVISHANLVHQLRLNADALGLDGDSRSVLWVPHFHDFGLISGICSAAFGNGRLYLISPLDFIARPAVWPEAMSRVRATHTAAPNFAYELVQRKTSPAQRRGWDLSSLEVAMTAAEPISPKTQDSFAQTFAEAGFRRSAQCPAYGLAEHTVGVTVGGRARVRVERDALERADQVVVDPREESEGVELVGCGAVPEGVELAIVDPDSHRRLLSDRVGEIWVSSGSKAEGYFGRAELSEQVFRARILGDEGDTTYLRTGDLGFLAAGELFVTGRLKDLIIVRGRNIYPQDVEATVRASEAPIRPGGIAAFSVPNADGEGERLCVLVELSEQSNRPREVAKTVREAIFHGHQLETLVVVGRRGAVAKTTSGKVRRRACRKAYLARQLPVVFESSPVARTRTPLRMAPSLAETVEAIEPSYQALIAQIGARFHQLARARGERTFHARATVLRAELEMQPDPALPEHPLFAPGCMYPCVLRHANGVQTDDAALDNRGASLRVLWPDTPEQLDRPLLDLLLTTGPCFVAASATAFARWMAASHAERTAIAEAEPHIGAAARALYVEADSYSALTYYSKVASVLRDEQGAQYYVRFRLRPLASSTPLTAFTSAAIPPEHPQRRPEDDRSPSFLHEALRSELEHGPIRYLLELQCRSAEPASEEESDPLDCTRPWPEERFAWRRVAELRAQRCIDDELFESLHLNPNNAPAGLQLIPARQADEPASLGHLRAIIYELAACARRGVEPEPALARLLQPDPAPRPSLARAQRVCVIGAGPAGLSAARELEALGHEVSVYEIADSVGGKSRTTEIDGRVYDLGAHICTNACPNLHALVRELGLQTQPVTPSYVLDEDGPRAVAALQGTRAYARYLAVREQEFGRVHEPGFVGLEPATGMALSKYLEHCGLTGELDGLLAAYTGSGYGPADAEIPAQYFLKFIEYLIAPVKDPAVSEFWTLSGGMGSLWQAVAAELADLRTGEGGLKLERDADGVMVRSTRGDAHFDAAVIASPPSSYASLMALDEEEERLVAELRTLDYCTVIARASGLDREGFYNLSAASGRRLAAFHHRYPDSDVYLLYAYADGLEDAALERILRVEVEALGGTLDEVLELHRWAFFPHVSPSAAQQGWFADFEARQGRERTYFVGSSFAFELVEPTVAHARATVRRHFQPLRARAAELAEPEPAPVPAPALDPALLRQLHALEDRARRLSLEASQLDSAIAALSRTLTGQGEGPELALSEQVVPMLERLLDIVRDELALGARAAQPEDHFIALGLDSINSVQLFERIADETGVRLPPTAVVEHPTVASLAAHLETRSPAPRRALSRTSSPEARGGGRLDARGLSEQLIEITRAELGLGSRELQADEHFIALGLDSINSVQLFERIRERTGVSLPPTAVVEHPSIGALVAHLAQLMGIEARREVKVEQPRAAAAITRPEPAHDLSERAIGLEASEDEARLEQLIARWRGRPASAYGLWSPFELAALARVPAVDDPARPRYPEHLQQLAELARAPGPRARVGGVREIEVAILCLSCARSLMQWRGWTQGRHEDAIVILLDAAFEALEALERERAEPGLPYGRYCAHFWVPLHTFMLHSEAQLVLNGNEALSPERESLLARFVHAEDHAPFSEHHIEGSSALLAAGQYFDEALLRSDATRRLVERAHTMPGGSASMTARYLGLTGDPKAAEHLERVRHRPWEGLRPDARPQEVQFTLQYLIKGGFDIRARCDAEIDYLLSIMGEGGVGIHEAMIRPDCDSTAVALYVCNRLGLDHLTRGGAEVLEGMWSEAHQSYHGVAGFHHSVSTAMNVLEATLSDARLSLAAKRRVWTRVIALLERRAWTVLDHYSPFYIWEKVVSVVSLYGEDMPPTRVHLDALEQVLSWQGEDGGFANHKCETNVEETALGLMALSHAWIGASLEPELGRRVEQAAARACAFLEQRWTPDSDRHPAFWIGTMTFSPVHLIDAMVLAALNLHRRREALRAARRPETGRGSSELRVEVSGLSLAARVWGDEGAPKLLALHGWLDNAGSFAALAEQLPEWQVVAPELPGHGLSDALPAGVNYHFMDIVELLVGFIDELGWKRYAILGHSLGATLGSAMAALRPDAVESVVSIEALGPASSPSDAFAALAATRAVVREREQGLSELRYATRDEALRAVAGARAGLSTAGAQRLLERGASEEQGQFVLRRDPSLTRRARLTLPAEQGRSLLARLRAPLTLVVASKGSFALDSSESQVRLALLSEPRVVEVSGGHCAHMDPSPALVEVVQEGLGRRAPQRSKSGRSTPELVDWPRTSAWPATHEAPSLRSRQPWQRVLLTGATGFYGAFLLVELLEQSTAEVVCIARASSDEAASQRVRDNLEHYGLWRERYAERIVTWAGDLELRRLGLSPERWAQLSEDTDALVHNGARVHFTAPYALLHAANVEGTRTMLELATTRRLKEFHHVSTLGVFSGYRDGGVVLESECPSTPATLTNGYTQSKWVAEQLVFGAERAGVPVKCYRPGVISGDVVQGRANPEDILSRLLHSLLGLGEVPEALLEVVLDIIGVDQCARAQVAIALGEASATTYHLVAGSGMRLRDLIAVMRDQGCRVDVVPTDQWLDSIRHAGTDDRLFPLLGLFQGGLKGGVPKQPRIDMSNTRAMLEDTGLLELSRESLALYVDCARAAARG